LTGPAEYTGFAAWEVPAGPSAFGGDKIGSKSAAEYMKYGMSGLEKIQRAI